MATYEYKCPACGHEFEVERRISDEAPQSCLRCGHEPCDRLISRSNFILRGTGWGGDRSGTDVVDKNWLAKFKEPETRESSAIGDHMVTEK